ncbi:SufE family protein [Pseudobdellovibrio exovorus]|uniref:Regulator of cysteine desulfurase activity n=1 Tax=Pseudobdellovibrio exovorus JSS TaxID=1184267 RepID=M4V850_9BACT|nr:SufE family protein [Pseudobdellovibrio exovorus]AGH95562.1 regulator of cysteine desulfurase activity [Pseudobdellovibrio exovorus JSS]
MRIEEKIELIKKDFPTTTDWEQKYEKIIEYGKRWEGLDDALKTEDLKVKGCQSQVWIKADLTPDKKIIFKGDSDAIIVKGLVAIVLKVYSGETPDVILKTEPDFLKDIGFDSGLSPSRTNGLYSMIKQIKYYATAFRYLLSK